MLKLLICYINRGYYLFKDRLERVALFGGSFDPPHFGHRLVVEEALRTLNIDRLIVVPTFLNPFKRQFYATPKERFLLSKEIFNSFSKVMVSDYEIEQGEATPTFRTVAYFQKKYDVAYIIIGADNLNAIDRWYNFEWLNKNITWVIASRRGYAIESDKLRDFILLEVDADISSTQIRNQEKNRK
jgi:nicotinate-nucleotide adenylyltransferase